MDLLLALPACPSDYTGDAVIRGIVIVTRRLENAGRQFFDRFERNLKEEEVGRSPADNGDSPKGEEEEADKWDEKHKNDKKKKKESSAPTKLKRLISGPNLYVALGLTDCCSVEAIRKAYRRLALEYHPDKQTKAKPKKRYRPAELENISNDEYFLLIQDAYETLSDSSLRKQYDSALPFDESIPSSSDVNTDCESFFNVFGPVFARNARWSQKKPVPLLGTGTLSYRETVKFYEFWWNFQSIRDFSVHDEYDVADAESREERRWMERQNQRAKKKYLIEEKSRISKLTELAYSMDPRVKAQKEQERLKKEEAKEVKMREEKIRMQLQKEEEQQRLAEEEAKQKLEAELKRQQTERSLVIKAATRKLRQRLRRLSASAVSAGLFDQIDIEILALESPLETLESMVATLETVEDRDDCIIDYLNKFLQDKGQKSTSPKANYNPIIPPAASRMPTPAIVTVCKNTNLEKTTGQAPAVWSKEELSLLAKGIQKFPGGTAQRWEHIATLIGTRSKEEPGPLTRPAAPSSQVQPELKVTQTNTQPAASSSTAATETNLIINSDWTDSQQQSLEKALKAHPSTSNAKERWIRIAEDVKGKSPKECIQRFKEIRQAILSASK